MNGAADGAGAGLGEQQAAAALDKALGSESQRKNQKKKKILAMQEAWRLIVCSLCFIRLCGQGTCNAFV